MNGIYKYNPDASYKPNGGKYLQIISAKDLFIQNITVAEHDGHSDSFQVKFPYRYIDDLISFNNKRFKEFISDIYPKELTISETTESTSVASYLDLLFTRDRSNNITTKLYDKRDAFGFHIVNFPFMSSNIPSAPAYGIYASQLVRCARCCSSYSDFLMHHRALVKRLLSQGYKVNRLSNTFKKFYGRHTDLVGQYKKNVCQMFADSIS